MVVAVAVAWTVTELLIISSFEKGEHELHMRGVCRLAPLPGTAINHNSAQAFHSLVFRFYQADLLLRVAGEGDKGQENRRQKDQRN